MKEVNTNTKTTEEIQIPKKLIEQVIGQDQAVEVIKKAAVQKRHVLLVGEPGTGKSMLGLAMAELLPKEELQDILVYPGIEDKNNPEIKVVPAGEGKQIVSKARFRSKEGERKKHLFGTLIIFGILFLGLVTWVQSKSPTGFLVAMLVAVMVFIALGTIRVREEVESPKLLISNQPDTIAPFVDACLLPGQKVFANPRPVKIEETEGLTVFNAEGEKQKVTKVEWIPYSGKIYHIKPRLLFPFTASPNHPFLVLERQKTKQFKEREFSRLREINLTWKRAKELKPGDMLIYSELESQKEQVIKFENDGCVKKIKNVKCDEKVAEILGWYLAEGYARNDKERRKYCVGFVLGANEEKEANHLKDLIEKKFGVKVSVYRNRRSSIELVVYSKALSIRFEKEFDKDAKSKKIPEFIFNLPKSVKISFLKAYFKGDGYENENEIGFATSSKDLADDLVFLLSTLGIFPTCYQRKMKDSEIDSRTIKGAYLYEFHIRGTQLRKLGKKKGKFQHYFTRGKLNFIPIRKIWTEDYRGYIINMETEDGTYLMPCITHNTGAHAGALLGDVRHDPFQCIPDYEQVQLPNGRPIKISKLLDRFFEDKHSEEIELHPNQQFEVLAGFDERFGFIKAKAVKAFRKFYEGTLIELETKRGYKIRVTPNHPIAIFNANGTVKYIEAARIKKGILTIVPYKLPIETKGILNKEKLLLYADILADGYVGERSVIFKLRREFKIKWILTHIQACGLKPNVLVRNKDTLIYINSAEFVRELSHIGLLEDGKKKIPSIIFDQPAKNIKTFIAEYFAIDGYVGKQGQFELISKELISDFVSLLLKIGIKAKVRERIDRGFGKGKIQPELIFSNYEFAKFYYPTTTNPYHRQNLTKYLRETRSTHVTYDDNIPLGFDVLERLRDVTGLSRARIHKSYYAMNPKVDTYTTPTRGLLRHVVSVFQQHLNCPEFYKLRDIVYGSYGFDEIVNLRLVRYKGYVYNVTTTTGNYLVNNILTHNSGGLETPAHERVEAGAIHRAHKGVLFIDEIATLGPRSQQELLTAMQEKAYPITGQSERSSGALTRTKPVPCDFILIAAGNLPVVEKMHPALRSRMRGYGYEVYMNDTIPDTPENQEKLARFVAQEVIKDGKIPHFAKEAVEEIIREAKRRSGRKGHLTLRLRDLGGLIRAAGDIARSKGAKYVELEHVLAAKDTARTLEKQLADRFIERKKEYQVFKTVGAEVGRVNGLAVIGPDSGVILPIVAEVAPALSREEGRVIATGKLGEIAKEAVQNVSALIKKYTGQNIKDYDIHVQFIMSHEGVEGDSASISVATAVFSALEGVPVDQSVAMTGSLSVRGEVLPVGGTTPKIEAAVEAGIKKVLVPKANEKEVFLEEKKTGKIEVIPVESITDVLENALVWKDKKDLLAKLRELAAKTIPRLGIFEREKPTPT